MQIVLTVNPTTLAKMEATYPSQAPSHQALVFGPG